MHFVTDRRFKQLLRPTKSGAGQVQAVKAAMPADVALCKEFYGQSDRLGDRQFRFTISTASVDRMRDTISVGGWDLTNYLRNPVVLWCHGFDPTVGTWPIGKAFDIGPENGVLKASVEFDPEDMPMTGPAAAACARKLADGSMFAVSVGFRPLEYSFSEDPARGGDDWFPGVDFKRQELLEFSIVSVPANAEAVLDVQDDRNDVPVGNPPPVLDLALSPEVIAAKAAQVARRAAMQRTARVFALG